MKKIHDTNKLNPSYAIQINLAGKIEKQMESINVKTQNKKGLLSIQMDDEDNSIYYDNFLKDLNGQTHSSTKHQTNNNEEESPKVLRLSQKKNTSKPTMTHNLSKDYSFNNPKLLLFDHKESTIPRKACSKIHTTNLMPTSPDISFIRVMKGKTSKKFDGNIINNGSPMNNVTRAKSKKGSKSNLIKDKKEDINKSNIDEKSSVNKSTISKQFWNIVKENTHCIEISNSPVKKSPVLLPDKGISSNSLIQIAAKKTMKKDAHSNSNIKIKCLDIPYSNKKDNYPASKAKNSSDINDKKLILPILDADALNIKNRAKTIKKPSELVIRESELNVEAKTLNTRYQSTQHDNKIDKSQSNTPSSSKKKKILFCCIPIN